MNEWKADITVFFYYDLEKVIYWIWSNYIPEYVFNGWCIFPHCSANTYINTVKITIVKCIKDRKRQSINYDEFQYCCDFHNLFVYILSIIVSQEGTVVLK